MNSPRAVGAIGRSHYPARLLYSNPEPAMRSRPLLAALLLLACGWSAAAIAAPAPWYWWQSADSERRVCAQHSPAPNWQRVSGPFRNAACKP